MQRPPFFRSQNCSELKLAASPKTQPKVHVLQNHMPDTQSVTSISVLESKHTVVLSLDVKSPMIKGSYVELMY